MAESVFPNGCTRAVLTSWNEGPETDVMMARRLDVYGMKGTFYVTLVRIGQEGYLDRAGLREIRAAGHEIGLQGIHLPELEGPSLAERLRHIQEQKSQLEDLIGAPVVSFAYPRNAPISESYTDLLQQAGYTSARVTEQSGVISIASLREGDLFHLPVTAFYTEDYLSIQSKWDAADETEGGIFHLWGLSAELGMDANDWVDFECNLGALNGLTDVWYATVGELISALKGRA